jgi:hypothetical protein
MWFKVTNPTVAFTADRLPKFCWVVQKGTHSSPSQHCLPLGHKMDINCKSNHLQTLFPLSKSYKHVGILPRQTPGVNRQGPPLPCFSWPSCKALCHQIGQSLIPGPRSQGSKLVIPMINIGYLRATAWDSYEKSWNTVNHVLFDGINHFIPFHRCTISSIHSISIYTRLLPTPEVRLSGKSSKVMW